MSRQRNERNIRLLKLHAMLCNMSFVVAVIVPYYRDHMGLTFQDFLIGEAGFAATVLLLEVPSGWLSDVWQRRHVMGLGTLFFAAGYALMLPADTLLMAVVAQSVVGVGISLLSGTNSALLYDSLLSLGREGEYRRHEGARLGLGLYSVAGASVASGVIYAADPAWTVALTVTALLVALVVSLMLHEPERHRETVKRHPVADMLATARYALHGHAEVGMIILFAAFLFSATKLIMWAQQPYYLALGVPETAFGLLMAVGFCLGGLSSQLGHRLDGRIGSIQALASVWIAATICCLLASFAVGWHGIGLLMLSGTCLYGIAAPRVSEAVNRHVTSARRATVLSTQSLMTALLFIPLSLGVGQMSDIGGVTLALKSVAGWLLLAGLCLTGWQWGRHSRAAA